MLAEQHVYWREQGRQALKFQKDGFERAAQEYEQVTRDEVTVAVAQATEMSGAELLVRTNAIKQRAQQAWTSHEVTLLNEMNCVAGAALEMQRRYLLSEAISELQRHQRQNQEHLQEYQQDVQRHWSEVQNEAQKVSKLRVEKKWEIGDMG